MVPFVPVPNAQPNQTLVPGHFESTVPSLLGAGEITLSLGCSCGDENYDEGVMVQEISPALPSNHRLFCRVRRVRENFAGAGPRLVCALQSVALVLP